MKVLPAYADDVNRANFLHEIEFMKNLGYHTHILSLIGYVSNRFAPKIVTELCANGDVLRFLRTNKSNFVPVCSVSMILLSCLLFLLLYFLTISRNSISNTLHFQGVISFISDGYSTFSYLFMYILLICNFSRFF